MNIITIIAGVLLFNVILFGSLFWVAKSKGFTVPDNYVSPKAILNFSIPDTVGYENKRIERINELNNVVIEGEHDAWILKLDIHNESIVVACIYWNDENNASRFWKRYYKSISTRNVRRSSFRNNLWKPKFVTGRFGWKSRFDISAWHQDNWFFIIATSTKVPNYHEIKIELSDRFIEHIRILDAKG